MRSKFEIISIVSIILTGILVMVIAFQREEIICVEMHYLLRSISEAIPYLAFAIYARDCKYISVVCLYSFFLSLNSLYDEIIGDPKDFSLWELIICFVASVIFYSILKNRIKDARLSGNKP